MYQNKSNFELYFFFNLHLKNLIFKKTPYVLYLKIY